MTTLLSPLPPVKSFQRTLLTIEHPTPLCSINTAKGILSLSAEDIMSLITDGQIQFAWDIGTGSRHKEIRIWIESLRLYQGSLGRAATEGGAPRAARRDPSDSLPSVTSCSNLTEADVIARIIQHSRETLRATELQRLLNCDWIVVKRHIESGALTLAPGPALRAKETPRITRQSFLAFMLKRREPQ